LHTVHQSNVLFLRSISVIDDQIKLFADDTEGNLKIVLTANTKYVLINNSK